jgi:hypothetical protein
MADATILSNPFVSVNAVSLTGFCTAASFTRTVEALDDTAFGATARTMTGGLENNELTLTLFMSYGAGEVYATLKDLVGTTTTVIVKPDTSQDYGTTNPGFTLTGAYLESLPVVSASVGELQSIDITFSGGSYTVDTTP